MKRSILSPRSLPTSWAFTMAVGMGLSAISMAVQAQEKVLRIAMTAADIPRTLGQPDQGFEGNRFTGIPMYDALTHWDLSKADAPSGVGPGLATSWTVGASDKTKWTFKLRPGIKFHDGSTLTAEDVKFTLDRITVEGAMGGQTSPRQGLMGPVASVEAATSAPVRSAHSDSAASPSAPAP